MNKGKTVLESLVASAVSGVAVAMLFPPFDVTVLVWIGLIPLLVSLWLQNGKGAGRRGFFLGWFAGLVSCGIQFDWIGVVTLPGAIILTLYLGLFWGGFGLYASTWGNPWREPIVMVETTTSGVSRSFCLAISHGAVWGGLEVLRGWLFTGFGWNPLGVAFHESPVIAQSADLLGVSGISMVLVFFQAVLTQSGRRLILSAKTGKKSPRWDFLAAAGVIGGLLVYGIFRMQSELTKESDKLKALLVQINIPQDASQQLWEPLKVHMAYEDETEKALLALADVDAKRLEYSAQHTDVGEIHLSWPDWVVWPESALTGRIVRAAPDQWGMWQENWDSISRIRKAGPFQLIQGTVEIEGVESGENGTIPKESGKVWNSLAVLSPNGSLQSYHKRHLVIFGETIPFMEKFPLLKAIYKQQTGLEFGGAFTPGTSNTPLAVSKADGKIIGVIPSICFEDTVARITRSFLRTGPQVIVNVTNDGWFKESAAAAQHFANARFRTIEFRRPMLRSANSGVSAAVDTTGRLMHPESGAHQIITDSKGSHFTRGTLLAELHVPTHPTVTLYARLGDSGIISLFILALAVGGWRHMNHKKLRNTSLLPGDNVVSPGAAGSELPKNF